MEESHLNVVSADNMNVLMNKVTEYATTFGVKILAALARRLVHESFRTSILQAPDAGTVADIITREVNPS